MYIRKFNKVNNSSRFKKKIVSFYLNKKKFKRLIICKLNKSGTNFYGKKVFLHKKKGMKKNIVKILKNFNWTYKIAICINISKFSSKSCFVALIKYSNGSYSYILASNLLKPGDFIYSSNKFINNLNKFSNNINIIIKYLNYKNIFFNLEKIINQGSLYSKSAGTFCKIINFDWEKNMAKIKLPTNKIILINIYCFVTLGRASNIYNKNQFFTKAGYNIKKGFKPIVRGVAMNPVDHPHGGRTKTNKPELTPWGKIAKFNK